LGPYIAFGYEEIDTPSSHVFKQGVLLGRLVPPHMQAVAQQQRINRRLTLVYIDRERERERV
jgi:hypothetical protein